MSRFRRAALDRYAPQEFSRLDGPGQQQEGILSFGTKKIVHNLCCTFAAGKKIIVDAPDMFFDYIGIGFGPSNLALAVAATECPENLLGIYFDKNPCFQWHPGMIIDGARMQISYLKDLVTLRNPSSPFSFLQYLKAKGRLEKFVNLCEFCPTRIEYENYLAWAAQAFQSQVHYGATVRRVSPVMDPSGEKILVCSVDVQYQDETCRRYQAKGIVYSPGGSPNTLNGCVKLSPRVLHSEHFTSCFPAKFPAGGRHYSFAVVGDGQTSAEIVKYLMDVYPSSRIYLIISGFSLRPADSTPFANEIFFSKAVDWFYEAGQVVQSHVLDELRNTNYGVVDNELLRTIYQATYADEVNGVQRLAIVPLSRLLAASENQDRVEIAIEDLAGKRSILKCDALLLATGYERKMDTNIFAGLLPFLKHDSQQNVVVSRHYRAETVVPMEGGLYLQGLTESSHGLGDSLLSLLPFRSQEILDDLRPRLAKDQSVIGPEAAVRIKG
jgi:lysine/ornithine N-monooxygenase